MASSRHRKKIDQRGQVKNRTLLVGRSLQNVVLACDSPRRQSSRQNTAGGVGIAGNNELIIPSPQDLSGHRSTAHRGAAAEVGCLAQDPPVMAIPSIEMEKTATTVRFLGLRGSRILKLNGLIDRGNDLRSTPRQKKGSRTLKTEIRDALVSEYNVGS
jgi:hypothetical protein